MAGNEKHTEMLRERYPEAADVDCDGWGTANIRGEGEKWPLPVRCPFCEHERLVQAIGAFIPPRFKATITPPEPVAAWAALGREAQGLYLTGQVGTGKTHTAWMAVAAWCAAAGVQPYNGYWAEGYEGGGWRGPNIVFTRMTDLLDDLRPGDDSRLRIRDCQRADLLAIDDLGAEKASEWTQERFYSIIDHRYANCLPLIVTSNLPASKLAAQTGERAASRLAEMCTVVPLTGADRRKPAA